MSLENIKYFTLGEFEHSNTADYFGINNKISDDVIMQNSEYTLWRLDQIRSAYGKPIIITSGYRCPELNRKVGGKKNSQHLSGQAADLKWDEDLLQFILSGWSFDQLIEEHNKYTKWIHISFRKDGERKQFFKI